MTTRASSRKTAMELVDVGPASAIPQSGVIKVDGRRERTKRTRAAIVKALTELLDEGRIEPTGADIAKRAKVAVRSIGQHFLSREDLMLAVADHHRDRISQPPPPRDNGPFNARLERFVAKRARTLESSIAMRRAAAVMLGRSPAVAQAVEQVAKQRRRDASQLFAEEIAACSDPHATERVLALISSGRAWDAMRGEMAMSVKASKELLQLMVHMALLGQPR